MKLSPHWLREFVNLEVDDRQLANDLTLAGVAVESITENGAFEMEITTNRPDCMNHYGVAREASAIYDFPLKPIETRLPKPIGKASFPIEIEDAQGCARYTARIVRNVKIGPSPKLIAERLSSLDQRSINNAADATNYTLWEMGHPTHAFDLDLLQGKIIVRRARAGETLKTLDGVDRKLSPEDLVIADAKRPVALAGVMGGFDTMITERTKNVLIEAAWFDPGSVRRSSRRHRLHTDASHRFERGADFAATSVACARVAGLIMESTGGQLEGEEIDVIGRRLEQPIVALSHAEIHRILGRDFSDDEVSRILRRLGFAVTPGRARAVSASSALPHGSGGLHAAIAEQVSDSTVHVPSWRLDVQREVDLIEELARIYGFDRFPNTLPAFVGSVKEVPNTAKDERLRTLLLALGYNEAISLTFIGREDAQKFSSAPAVELENPINEEAPLLRNSLIPGMLDMLAWNLNRGNSNARLFEAGNIFEQAGAQARERRLISLGAVGNTDEPIPHLPPRPCSFFDVKGDVENLLTRFEHNSLRYEANAAEYYHAGRSARAVMDGAIVARFGQLRPEIAASRKLRLSAGNEGVYIAEFSLDRLYEHALRQPQYEPLPRYPAVERDFSFVFDDTVSFERVRSAVEALKIPELRSFVPIEVFRGGAIPLGKYSLLLRATFQSSERTLREDEVARWSAQIVVALQSLGGSLRAQ